MSCLIYLPIISPRAQYVCKWIFETNFGIAYELTTDKKRLDNFEGIKIGYCHERIADTIFIKAENLLFESEIRAQEPVLSHVGSLLLLFPEPLSDTGFDLFASVFFLLSRYEEYSNFHADEHGRYDAQKSLAFNNGFLQIPIVDLWVEQLRSLVQQKYPGISLSRPKFTPLLTYDVDVAFKYKGRPLLRAAGAMVNDLLAGKISALRDRIAVSLSREADPWDSYEQISTVTEKYDLSFLIFFLLTNRKTRYDRNIPARRKSMVKLIRRFRDNCGIHPSYYTSDRREKLTTEKETLESICEKEIHRSRHHYLRFRLPETYRMLLETSITEDYSMGYADIPGFRAGTSQPFFFYDLEKEESTGLKIFPVSCMEGQFLKQDDASSALKTMKELALTVKKVNGCFIAIWHNHTISDDMPAWQRAHQQLLSYLDDISGSGS